MPGAFFTPVAVAWMCVLLLLLFIVLVPSGHTSTGLLTKVRAYRCLASCLGVPVLSYLGQTDYGLACFLWCCLHGLWPPVACAFVHPLPTTHAREGGLGGCCGWPGPSWAHASRSWRKRRGRRRHLAVGCEEGGGGVYAHMTSPIPAAFKARSACMQVTRRLLQPADLEQQLLAKYLSTNEMVGASYPEGCSRAARFRLFYSA